MLCEYMCVVQDMVYDLEDLEKWEPVLASATSKKKLMCEVLKRKENQLLGKITVEQEVCECVFPVYSTCSCLCLKHNCTSSHK